MSFSKLNPLDLTEIRTRIAQHLSVKDAISCVRVSKAWAKDFVHRVWHTVNFDVHNGFESISTDTVKKYGHHIRVVKNLKTLSQANTLRCPSVRGLRELWVSLNDEPLFAALSWNLISRNSSTLDILTTTYPEKLAPAYFSVDSIIPHAAVPCKLTNLEVTGFHLTRESFSLLLRECTSLVVLDLWGILLDQGPAFDDYQHFGIKDLIMEAKLVAGNPSGPNPSSPLFVHFPNVQKWSTYILPTDSVQAISSGVEQWWPKLRDINTNYSKGTVAKVLANIFQPLTSIEFLHSEISAELIHAVLLHQETLQTISAFTDDSSNAYDMGTGRLREVNDHFRDSGWVIQSIFRQCPKLEEFIFPVHEMDMDFVERSHWSCTGLRYLRTRIRHLDTKEKVDATITRLISARSSGTDIDPNDKSIEARVARHLLKFNNLKRICLGTVTYRY